MHGAWWIMQGAYGLMERVESGRGHGAWCRMDDGDARYILDAVRCKMREVRYMAHDALGMVHCTWRTFDQS